MAASVSRRRSARSLDLGRRACLALLPAGAFAGDGPQSLGAQRAFAARRVELGPRLRHDVAVGLRRLACCRESFLEADGGGHRGKRGFGFLHAPLRIGHIAFEAAPRFARGRDRGGKPCQSALGVAQSAARHVDVAASSAHGPDGARLFLGGLLHFRREALGFGAKPREVLTRRDALGLDLAEAIALGQPPRGGRGGVGRRRESVPAPDVALARHEHLAWPQSGAQAMALLLVDDADLLQPSPQRRGRLHEGRERRDAEGKRRIAVRLDQRPMRRGRRVRRGVEVLAQSRAERRLIALLGDHLVEDRRVFRVRGLEQFAQGARLGLEALRFAFGGGERSAAALLGFARPRMSITRGAELHFASRNDFLGRGHLGARGIEIGKPRFFALEPFEIAEHARELGFEPRRAARLLLRGARGGGTRGRGFGQGLLRLRQGGIARRKLGLGGRQAIAQRRFQRLVPALRLIERRCFRQETLEIGLRIAEQRFGAIDIGASFGKPSFELRRGVPSRGVPRRRAPRAR